MNKEVVTITGGSGFIGKNFICHFQSNYDINLIKRNDEFNIKGEVLIHLAGIAHDLKKVKSPDIYYSVNEELTKKLFEAFLLSDAKAFIFLSSVKAVADKVESELFEDAIANPFTHYGKSKLLAEEYLLRSNISSTKRLYILRPCMVHGPGNKGNLNLLYKFVRSGIPWPLGAFSNKRSYCCIDNLMFIFQELLTRSDIPSGIYNIADNETLSTNDLIRLLSDCIGKENIVVKIPQKIVHFLAHVGDWLHLPFNSEMLDKLTESYVVNNNKITNAIGKFLPFSAKEGLCKTFKSFNNLHD